jgi:integrase
VVHGDGRRISELRGAFARVWCNAGLTGFHFHCLGHLTMAMMRRGGVDALTTMQVTGHKTMAVFQRYNSIHENELPQATAHHINL